MALGAVCLIHNCAVLRITGTGAHSDGILEAVWRKVYVFEPFRSTPARPHSLDQYINLLIGQVAPGLLREQRRARAPSSLGDHLTQLVVAHQSEVERIVEGPRRSQASTGAVTTGAVCGIELGKICDFRRGPPALLYPRLSRQAVAARSQDER